jgi:hypothetical protein
MPRMEYQVKGDSNKDILALAIGVNYVVGTYWLREKLLTCWTLELKVLYVDWLVICKLKLLVFENRD